MGTANRGNGDAHKILLVDDAQAICEAYGGMLRKKGYYVDTVNSGEQAIQKIGDTPYDIVLLDLKLEGISGLETLQRIRSRNKDVKVLIMSAFLTESHIEQSYQLGVFNCIEKPFSIETLSLSIRQALSLL